MAPATTADPPALPFDVLVFVSPRRALRTACDRLPSAALVDSSAEAIASVLDVVEAAVGAGHAAAAERVLDALLPFIDAAADGVGADLQARAHLLAAECAHERSDAARKGAEIERARAALQAAGFSGTQRFADVLVALAGVWRHRRADGDLQRADDALEQAAALLRSLGLEASLPMALVFNERTMLANARQDLPGALAAAFQERDVYRRLGHGDSAALLDVQASLGALLSQLGRHEEAVAEFEEGVRLIDRHPDEYPAAALGVVTNLAATYNDLGRLDLALLYGDRAVADAERVFGADAARLVRPLSIRGATLKRLARYGEARSGLERALAIATEHPGDVGPLRRLNLYDLLATTSIVLGEVADARALIERGLHETATTAQLGYWRGRLLLIRGTIAARAGNWAAVDADTAQAITLIGAVVGERNPYVLDMSSQRCFAQSNGALPGTACADVAAALPALNDAPASYRFRALAVLADDDERRGRRDNALLHHLQAVAAAESVATPDPLWSAYAALAQHLRARNVNGMAILLAKQAVEQIERMRGLLGADAQRFERAFLADKLAVYRRLADWLTQDGRIDEALDVLRLLKEEEFLDFVNRDGGLLGRGGTGPAYTDQETALRRSWSGGGRADVQAQPQPQPPNAAEPDSGAAAAQLQREAAFVAHWYGPLDRLAANAAAGSAQAAPSRQAAASAPDRRVAPPAGELWVWLYPGDRRVNLVIDAPNRRTVSALDAAPADLAAAVARLLGAIERRESVQAQLRSLHALIGAPVERAAAIAGDTRRIVFSVDGPLRYLPFAALHDGSGYLGDRYAVEQRVPVPPAAGAAVPARRNVGASVLAMGVTRAIAGMVPLAEVAREICGIVAGPVVGLAAGDDAACGATGASHGAMPGSGWVNDAFTADRLQVAIAGARQQSQGRTSVLHIGTHFVLRPGRMSRSWLLLGNGRQLSLEALGRLDFSGQSLVTLSACETGIGGVGGGGGLEEIAGGGTGAGTSADGGNSGAEIDGLGGLMLRRGAGAVVASLWRIADASTSLLMQRFYRHMAAGIAPAEALQRAQAELRAAAGGRMAHPFYWAGFHLVKGMH